MQSKDETKVDKEGLWVARILALTNFCPKLSIPFSKHAVLSEDYYMTFEGKWTIRNDKSDLNKVAHPGMVEIFTARNRNEFLMNTYTQDLYITITTLEYNLGNWIFVRRASVVGAACCDA